MVHNCSWSLSPLSPPPPHLSLFSPLFSTHLSSTQHFLRSPHPVWSGPARGFFQLMRELFLSTVTKVLLIVGTVGFLYDSSGLDLLCKVP